MKPNSPQPVSRKPKQSFHEEEGGDLSSSSPTNTSGNYVSPLQHSGSGEMPKLARNFLQMCQREIKKISEIYKRMDRDDEAGELQNGASVVHDVISRCLTQYGDLNELNSSQDLNQAVQNLYDLITSYDKKLNQLQKNKTLMRFITQSRLRAQIDKINNKTLEAVQNLEKLIKGFTVDHIYSNDRDEFKALMKEIDKMEAPELLKRTGVSQSLEKEKSIEDEHITAELDNKLSIIRDPKARAELLKELPKMNVQPLTKEDDMGYLISVDENDQVVGDYACGRSISTYPIDQQTMRRDGDPICDQFCAQIYENRVIVAVADGCNWGMGPKVAAQKATRMFISYMKRRQHLIRTIHDAGILIMRAFAAAHQAIVHEATEDGLYSCGTTTMIAGLVLELEKEHNGAPFAFVYGSIGDCKGYHYSQAEKKMVEITKGNRGMGNYDPRNPGGRLGPHLEGGEPDISNFLLTTVYCRNSDFLTLVSDGVHDNLDPRQLGVKPRNIGLDYDSWNDINKKGYDENIEDHIFQFIEDKVNGLIKHPLTVRGITNCFLQNSVNTTSNIRNFMQDHPGKRVPEDYERFPGKLDHTTAFTLKIGRKTKASAEKPYSELTKTTSEKAQEVLMESPYGAIPASFKNASASQDNDSKNAIPLPDSESAWERMFGKEILVVSWDLFMKEFQKLLGTTIGDREEKHLKTVIDPSETRSVSHYKFLQFLKGFGPLNACVQKTVRILEAEWFQAGISLDESKCLLQHQPVGTFLVRLSGTKHGNFVLDYVREVGTIRCISLVPTDSGIKVPLEGSEKNQHFSSIADCVTQLKSQGVLKHHFTPTIQMDQSWFFADLSREECEELLKDKSIGTFLIRLSSKPGCFAASFVGTDKAVKHGIITKHESGGYQVKQEGVVFKSLDALISHYYEEKIFISPFKST